MKKKYPDNIVYNDKLQKFDANIKPYPTSVGSQAFEPIKVDKSTSVSANHYFNSRLEELREEYKKLIQEYNWTKLVYESSYAFQPIVGHTYHMYEKKDKSLWLSLIGPDEWNQPYVGSFQLQTDGKWIKI
jgi:predicted RNA-binding protein (virulence factor B family)